MKFKHTFKPTSLIDALSFVTIKISCLLSDGRTSTGTGFFYNLYEEEDAQFTVIVTNKHVVAGAITGTLIFNKVNEDGTALLTDHYIVTLNDFEKRWLPHPEDDIDLCIMVLAPVVNDAQEKDIDIYFRTISKLHLPSKETFNMLEGLENTVMIGYPNGFSDTTNNKPLFRKGITATSPKIDYCGKPIFLIDSAVFPGSSGSPVFLFESGPLLTDKGMEMTQRILFVGIVFAVFNHNALGEIVQQPINEIKLSVITGIPNHIGLVIRYEKLLDFERYFKFTP